MRKNFLIIFTIFTISFYVYGYLNKINEVTFLKLKIPKLEKEVYAIRKKNKKLKLEIEKFENPQNLMKFLKDPHFSHLKHPLINEILKIPQGLVLKENNNISNFEK